MGIGSNGSAVAGAAQTPLKSYFLLLGGASVGPLQPEVCYTLGSPRSGIQVTSSATFGMDAQVQFHPLQRTQPKAHQKVNANL